MMQPRRLTNVGAAMIADRTNHARLHVVESDVIGEAADVQFSVAMTVRIVANDKHMFSAVTSHVGQRHGLIVKHQDRDRPGHPPSNC